MSPNDWAIAPVHIRMPKRPARTLLFMVLSLPILVNLKNYRVEIPGSCFGVRQSSYPEVDRREALYFAVNICRYYYLSVLTNGSGLCNPFTAVVLVFSLLEFTVCHSHGKLIRSHSRNRNIKRVLYALVKYVHCCRLNNYVRQDKR